MGLDAFLRPFALFSGFGMSEKIPSGSVAFAPALKISGVPPPQCVLHPMPMEDTSSTGRSCVSSGASQWTSSKASTYIQSMGCSVSPNVIHARSGSAAPGIISTKECPASQEHPASTATQDPIEFHERLHVACTLSQTHTVSGLWVGDDPPVSRSLFDVGLVTCQLTGNAKIERI